MPGFRPLDRRCTISELWLASYSAMSGPADRSFSAFDTCQISSFVPPLYQYRQTKKPSSLNLETKAYNFRGTTLLHPSWMRSSNTGKALALLIFCSLITVSLRLPLLSVQGSTLQGEFKTSLLPGFHRPGLSIRRMKISTDPLHRVYLFNLSQIVRIDKFQEKTFLR